MKKTILFLAIIALAVVPTYAQTDLKASFEAITTQFDKDPVAFVQKMDDNLRFTGAEGAFFDKQKTLELANKTKGGNVETKILDLRVKQSGILAVASGIRHQVLNLPNGQKMTWKDAFTYTFEWRKNQWVTTDLHHTKINYQTGEEAAIRQVIDNETKAFHEANLAVWHSNWATTPYIERQDEKLRKLANVPYLKGEALQKGHVEFAKTHKPTGLSSVVSDYESHIEGNLAWATYTQEDRKADGSIVQKQRSSRILEKINGQWKIVMIGLTSF